MTNNSCSSVKAFGHRYEYIGPSLEGLSLGRTPLYKGHIRGSSTVNACDVPCYHGHLSNKDTFVWQKGCPY